MCIEIGEIFFLVRAARNIILKSTKSVKTAMLEPALSNIRLYSKNSPNIIVNLTRHTVLKWKPVNKNMLSVE